MMDMEMNGTETVLLSDAVKDRSGQENGTSVKPRLFVCFEHEIMEFVLSG